MIGSGRQTVAMFLGVLLLAVAILIGCAVGDDVSDRLDFRLESLSGSLLGPADYSGEVLIVDFWASWCAPCRVQHEVLTVLQKEYRDRGVAFLAVNSGEPEAVARAFASENPFEYPVLLDEDAAVSDRLGVLGLPTLLIVDREGQVTYFEPGLLAPREIRELLDSAGASQRPDSRTAELVPSR